jgi:D-alanine-D-alanine ligase
MFEIENFRDIGKLLSESEEVTFVKKADGVFMHPVNRKAFRKVKEVKIDLAFPIVHGTNCEDGTIAGYFEFLGLPYISCDIISAAVGMDKAVFKDVLSAAGLPVLGCVRFTAREYMLGGAEISEKIKTQVGFPLIVKPINLGSSVGISKVKTENELDEAIRLAMSFADKILVERAVCNLREINCSVLGDGDDCAASVCEEPFMHDEILSYKDKYEGGAKDGPSKGMASLGRKIPADIPDELSERIRDISCRIFKAIGASGVVRIDYLLDNKSGEIYANEINTIPGSLAFYLWEATGTKYSELIDKLVDTAFRRERKRENLRYTIDTNILSGVSFGSKGSKGSKF